MVFALPAVEWQFAFVHLDHIVVFTCSSAEYIDHEKSINVFKERMRRPEGEEIKFFHGNHRLPEPHHSPKPLGDCVE